MKGMWRVILPSIVRVEQPPKLELTTRTIIVQDAPGCPENPKSTAAKGKPELSLIPTVALVEEAKALAEGADKYGAYNYLAARVQASAYIDAALRHVRAWMDGEDLDPSGASHLGHARASLAILLDAAAAGTLIDDRPHVLKSLYLKSKS